jgi:hypothetical protein
VGLAELRCGDVRTSSEFHFDGISAVSSAAASGLLPRPKAASALNQVVAA